MSSIPVTRVDAREARAELPAPPLRIALFTLVALAAGLSAAWGLSRPDSPEFAGRIEARSTHVTAERAGILTELLVAEGDRVTLGDPLVMLADGELQAEIARQQAEITTRESELQQARALADVDLAWRLKELDGELLETQLRSADYLKEKFNHQLERNMWSDVLAGETTAMFNQGDAVFHSIVLKSRVPSEQRMNASLRIETAANAIEVSQAQVEICERRLAELRRLKEEVPARIREKAGVNVAEERLAGARAELARLQARDTQLTIPSTAVGTVGVFRRRPGDNIAPGDPIVEILDDAQRRIVVEVPSDQITGFHIDSRVDLSFPGDQPLTGRVISIAPQAEPRSTAADDAVIAVRIEQTGKVWPAVPIGSRVGVRLSEKTRDEG